MRMFVGLTDRKWFDFLAARQPEEVNFWRPRSTANFKALSEGELFLFKLHAPVRAIVGGGVFVRHAVLPMSLTWEAFGESNGAASRSTFFSAIRNYRADERPQIDPLIGSIILSTPFFFDQKDWIAEPSDWSPSIVQGKGYDTSAEMGRWLFDQVMERLDRLGASDLSGINVVAEKGPRYGTPQIVIPRLGQGGFRVVVTEAYQRQCAITGEKTLPVLDASHIRPVAENGPNKPSNGLLMRKDLHALFDRGYLTVNEQFRVEVSNRIKEDYGNGREYYALHGKELRQLPKQKHERPAQEFLLWHNESVYVS